MTVFRLLTSIFVLVFATSLFASPESDLSSPSQEVRDAAAKVLRETYIPIPRCIWDSLISKLKPGITKADVLELLRPFKISPMGGVGGGGSYFESYRLDECWGLTCWYLDNGDVLLKTELSARMRNVWVKPPSDFSGVWITYYVNGQKSHEIQYKDGSYSEEFITYASDGSKSVVQHYDHNVAEGEDTGFYPSGHINYRGVYKAGAQIGKWIWYNEDGSIKSTMDYSKP